MQLTTEYWEPFGPARPGWLNLPYEIPPGCTVTNEGCPPETIEPEAGVTYCQLCPNNGSRPWNYFEWIMTDKPHLFGLMDGWANPTGVALTLILTLMVICSMPYVRRGGYFEVP